MIITANKHASLPPELWLHILEQASIHEAEHLWISVRHVSVTYKDYVERLFTTVYLPHFAISLSLPRRDPNRGALKWPGAIPQAQIIMSFNSICPDQRFALFTSPLALKDRADSTNVEELKNNGVLPQQRLREAPAWVHVNGNSLTGVTLPLPMDIEWDEGKKVWSWRIEWRRIVSQFYKAKIEARSKKSTASRTLHRSLRKHGMSRRG